MKEPECMSQFFDHVKFFHCMICVCTYWVFIMFKTMMFLPFHSSPEQQHVETNVKAAIAGISVVFAFHDENQRHSCDQCGDQANVGSYVHYLGAECRDMLFSSQVIIMLGVSTFHIEIYYPLIY